MGAMDEKPPVTIPGQPQATNPAQVLAQLVQAMAKNPAAMRGMPQMPQGGGTQGVIGGPPPNMASGPSGGPLPSAGGANMYGGAAKGPAGYPAPDHPAFSTGFEFRTRAGRNAAITAGTMQGISQSVQQMKQKKWDEEKNTAEQAAGQVMFYEQQAAEAMQRGDKEAAQRFQQAAQKLKTDKKLSKIFDKASTDYNSAAYVGVQAAYQNQMKKIAGEQAMEEARAKADSERAKAEQERATAALRSQEQWEHSEAGLAFKHKQDMELERLKIEAAAVRSGPKWEVKGDNPAVRDPVTNKIYTLDDVRDKKSGIPDDIAKMLIEERRSIRSGWNEQARRAATAQAAAMNRLMLGMSDRDKKLVGKAWDIAETADFQLKMMKDNAEAAKAGNQQAMVSVLSAHIALSLGMPKGVRITQTMWNNAERSLPLLQAIQARPVYDDKGELVDVKMGTVLSKQQIDQMIETAQHAFDDKYAQSRQKALWTSEYYGVPFKEYEPISGKPKSKATSGSDSGGGIEVKPDGTVVIK